MLFVDTIILLKHTIIYKEYVAWAKNRMEKTLPHISYAEYALARSMAESFILSKDRPWTLKNHIAWAMQKAFL